MTERAVAVATAAARVFARSTLDPEGCLLWGGAVNERTGYGVIRLPGTGTNVGVHRVAHEWATGDLDADLTVDHTCHTENVHSCPGGPACAHRRCVNPAHLQAVTPQENTWRGAQAQARTCQRGHPFDESNTGINSRGNRWCRTCQRATNRAAAARRRAS